MDIVHILKQLRQTQGWDQSDLAKQLGTTQQTVSNWESGKLPRPSALKKINVLLHAQDIKPITISTVIEQPESFIPIPTPEQSPLLLIVNTQNDCYRLVQLAQEKGMSVFITSKLEEAARFIEKS
jgi:transcriptional regulator with XRE-family HTH domain